MKTSGPSHEMNNYFHVSELDQSPQVHGILVSNARAQTGTKLYTKLTSLSTYFYKRNKENKKSL